MTNNRTKRYIELKENNKGVNNLRVEVYYDIGGYNYLSYTQKKRGFYASVTPVDYQRKNGYISEGFTAFSGYKCFLFETARFSQKAFEKAKTEYTETVERMIDRVLQENGLEIA